jgi:hypothetical protein
VIPNNHSFNAFFLNFFSHAQFNTATIASVSIAVRLDRFNSNDACNTSYLVTGFMDFAHRPKNPVILSAIHRLWNSYIFRIITLLL